MTRLHALWNDDSATPGASLVAAVAALVTAVAALCV